MSKRLVPDLSSNLNPETPVKRQRTETTDGKDATQGSGDEGENIGTQVSDTSQPVEILQGGRSIETIPFDVLLEIASNMTSADLLTLARTSRALRETLMAKSSAPIWRAARSNMKLLDGPDDLDEPLYAEILFGDTCFLCGGNGDERLLEHKLRLCRICYFDKSIDMDEYLKDHYPDADVPYTLIFPATGLPLDEYDEDETLSERFPEEPADSDFKKYIFWDVDAFRDIVEAHIEFPPDSKEREDFVRMREEYVSDICAHADGVTEWGIEWRQKNNYVAEIHRRLKDLGYTERDLDCCDDDRGDKYNWNYRIRDYRPLTCKRWLQILPGLMDVIKIRWEIRVRIDRKRYELGGSDDDEFYEGGDIEERMYRAGFGHFVNSYASQRADEGWYN